MRQILARVPLFCPILGTASSNLAQLPYISMFMYISISIFIHMLGSSDHGVLLCGHSMNWIAEVGTAKSSSQNGRGLPSTASGRRVPVKNANTGTARTTDGNTNQETQRTNRNVDG